MSNQATSAARMLQNFHYIAYLGMEKGGVTLSVRRSTSVSQSNGILQHKCCRISIIYPIWGWRRAGVYCLSVTTMSNQAKSAARMSQIFHYIAYLGMEKGGGTLSVLWSTSVSQTNGIMRHKCHRISIIHCILVTTMCHQW
jgi:predicted membrane metal-binding protein